MTTPKPTWEIGKAEFLDRLGCSEKKFQENLFLPKVKDVSHIIPLRFLETVEAMVPMSHEMLRYFVSRIKTLGGEAPFHDSSLRLFKIDANHLKIGQRYVYRENYQSLLETHSSLFGKFVISCGISDLGAYFVLGKGKDGLPALACYTPPFIEQHNHHIVIMDGIHRNYITKQLGATITAILIGDVAVPFPCGMRGWEEIKVISVDQKPREISERYFELNKSLFRDLKYLGIDG